MKIENIYTSVGCNRSPTCLDWGNNDFIIYGACCSICLLYPSFEGSAKVIRTFVKHTKSVNSVKWIRKANEKETSFISGGNDGLAVIWSIVDEFNSCKTILNCNSNAVYLVDAVYKDKGIVAITSCSDSAIRLWLVIDNEAECFQIINLKTGFCLGLTLSFLPIYNRLIIAEASDENNITIWVDVDLPEKYNFQQLHTLKGHEDWVRGLDFITTSGNELLLCSSSQDTFIRLWKIVPRLDSVISSNIPQEIEEDDIKIEESLFSIVDKMNKKITVAISVESILQGHEGWIYGVQWYKFSDNVINLLSASMDKTLIIWEFNLDVGIWTEKYRLGEVGGNSLGFYGGKFAGNGKSIIGHSFQGGLHIWRQDENDKNIWNPGIIVSGHFAEVNDISWEPNGEFLFSVSNDQTTRIHAPFRKVNNENNVTWHELARPQIHGYNMQTVAAISRYKFASGAEEKIVRMFQTTADFIRNFRKICKISVDPEGDSILKSLPKGASVPSLGLSNKAVFISDEKPEPAHVKDEYPENYFVSVILETPPQEENLMQNTLWPETHKLYGHGFEIFALASSHNSKLLASSCKANATEHANIYLWDSLTGKNIQKLSSHQLTVTQLKFSSDDNYLLSVSRDRSWSLFKNKSNDSFDFILEAKSDKTNGIHSRIIWSCDWSHDSKVFATSSRDGKVVLWKKGEVENENSLKYWNVLDSYVMLGESITAVSFAPDYYQNETNVYLLAVGMESGLIKILKFYSTFELLCTMNREEAHHLTVKKLQFNPCINKLLLASCGEDNFVRITELKY